MTEMVERTARGIYFASAGEHYAEQFHDEIWAGSLGLTDEDRHESGDDDDLYGFTVRGRNFYRKQARAALLAALDPEDDALVEIVARAIYVSEFCYDPPTAALVDDNWASCGVEARAAITALKASCSQGEKRT